MKMEELRMMKNEEYITKSEESRIVRVSYKTASFPAESVKLKIPTSIPMGEVIDYLNERALPGMTYVSLLTYGRILHTVYGVPTAEFMKAAEEEPAGSLGERRIGQHIYVTRVCVRGNGMRAKWFNLMGRFSEKEAFKWVQENNPDGAGYTNVGYCRCELLMFTLGESTFMRLAKVIDEG